MSKKVWCSPRQFRALGAVSLCSEIGTFQKILRKKLPVILLLKGRAKHAAKTYLYMSGAEHKGLYLQINKEVSL